MFRLVTTPDGNNPDAHDLELDAGGRFTFVDGVTGEIPWYPGVKGPYSDFAEELVKRTGIDMFDYPWTMSRMSSYLIMVQAVERAGAVDREKVKAALFKGTFDAPTGQISFDENGYAFKNGAFTLQIQKGKPVIVWPPDIATASA